MTRLTGVSETLLLPLHAKGLETRRQDGVICDPKAIEILDRLDYDFSRFGDIDQVQIGTAIRTEILDEQVNRFLDAHPDATVVNLGAGLCTRLSRVDNGRVSWFELDLEEVYQHWKRFYRETERHRFVVHSLLDHEWMARFAVEHPGSRPLLFVAEGVLMYFSEAEVRALLCAMAEVFPGATLLAELISPLMARNSQRHPISKTSATFQWGIQNTGVIETWSERLRFVEEWCYVDRYARRWSWKVRTLKHLPGMRRMIRIARLRFVPPESP
ncbi:MAG: class I SAM-dependent methyltransferase [Acidobacteriota bacterium]